MTKICKCCKTVFIKNRPLNKYINTRVYIENCFDCYSKIVGKTYEVIKKGIFSK